MSLSTPSPTAPLSLPTPNSSKWSSTVICQKLLYVCYYYARCFGMVAFGIKGCNESIKIKDENNLRGSSSISKRSNEIHIQPNSATNATEFVLQVNVVKSSIWIHFVIRFILCTCFTYGVFTFWRTENYIFSVLMNSLLITITICPILMVIVEICHKSRIIRAINDLFRLLQAIEQLHCSYEIFQWTHVAFVTIKVVTFVYEIILSMHSLLISKSWSHVAYRTVQSIFLIEVWLNLHVATLLYVCVEAMYGSLNHYIKHSFILRLKVMQSLGPTGSTTQVSELNTDLPKFMELFKKVHRVGLELHYLWQVPVVCTLVAIYTGTISVIYFMIWKYFEAGIIHLQYIPYTLKLVFDIMLLSLTAHRAIKSSKLIGCMGLENVVLLENEEWHRQIEQFLYHINLYDFRLNYMGLFDISNSITLTFISGLLTSMSIFVPFFIKAHWIQKFLEKQN